jgi:3-phosphoshikimate 1-carboxyvinyltransferase
VGGLGAGSLQGDAQFPEVLSRMGVRVIRRDGPEPALGVVGPPSLEPVLADLSDMPDAAMTLAAVACFAPGASILRGLRTLRVKECDRIEAMRVELGKIGVRVDSPVQGDPGAVTITPPAGGIDCSPSAPPVEFQTYDDHRMAMSLAIIGLRRPNVTIRHPACVGKTYPAFWSHLGALIARAR